MREGIRGEDLSKGKDASEKVRRESRGWCERGRRVCVCRDDKGKV